MAPNNSGSTRRRVLALAAPRGLAAGGGHARPAAAAQRWGRRRRRPDLTDQALKVFEMGISVFRDLVKLRHKYGLDGWAFELERQGAKGDAKTSYSLLPERQLTDDERAELARLELHDLPAVVAGERESTRDDRVPF